MKKFDLVQFLMNPRKWWIPLFAIFLISFAGVSLIGIHTYTEAPPIPDFISESREKIISKKLILEGQMKFQQYGLMEYGSMFGDGANRGPDFTAEALHMNTEYLNEYYRQKNQESPEAASARVIKELKSNTYQTAGNSVELSDAQVYSIQQLEAYYQKKLQDYFPEDYFTNESDIKELTAFFYWGAWVCAVERPGKNYSYTHNWPFDKSAGNIPSGAVTFWSIIGSLGLILGLGWVLYYHGRLDKLDDNAYINRTAVMTGKDIENYQPNRSQKATYKFFYAAILLFAVQVLSGILTVHDFVGFVNFFGFNISETLPITITRSWHVQLSLLWISACWIGASLFVMSMNRRHVKYEVTLINTIFWVIVLMVGGALAGIFLGPKGMLGKYWHWLGHQGWEYVELGKAWQWMLMLIFILWAITLFRGVKPSMKKGQHWALPNWLIYSTVCIIALLISGFIAKPDTNFVIADFWRWCVIHMWAEAFFEVFTTVLVGYFMVMMGLVNKQAAIRVIYLATLMFLSSGLLGISHNFYWNAKPVGTMALGSIFSTLQVVPLVLLTLEAWRFSKLPKLYEQQFGFNEVFLFLVGVNFWNFFGAGVMGFIINLPIANYYEHGTYLTVNHGHAALMGVYGNLALAALLLCCQLIFKKSYWNAKLLKRAFWSINIGLMLMVLLDLFPAGIWQLYTVMENGLWYGRSEEFISGNAFQSLTWLRIIGGSIFTVGGLIPICVFVINGRKHLKKSISPNEKPMEPAIEPAELYI